MSWWKLLYKREIMKKLLIFLFVVIYMFTTTSYGIQAETLSDDEKIVIIHDYYDYALTQGFITDQVLEDDIRMYEYYGEYNGYDIMIISKKLAALTDAKEKESIGNYTFVFDGYPLSEYFYAYKDGSFIQIKEGYALGLIDDDMLDGIADLHGNAIKDDSSNQSQKMLYAYYRQEIKQNPKLRLYHVGFKKGFGFMNGYQIAIMYNDLIVDDGKKEVVTIGNYKLLLTETEKQNLYAYKDGTLVSVQTLYDQKILSDDDIKIIAEALGKVEKVFVDLDSQHWGYQIALKAYQYGLIMGYYDHTFKPEQSISRSEVVTILYRMQQQPTSSYLSVFQDVPNNQWYSQSIMWAYQNQIIHGYGNGCFGVDDAIIRQDLAVILYHYAKSKQMVEDTPNHLARYVDVSDVDDYAYKAMNWCVSQGIITGGENGKYLYPKNSASRIECAKMMVLLYEMTKY